MTGNAALILQLLGGAGFLAGVAALLHFLNTAKGARTKSSAEAYSTYSNFVGDAMGKMSAENTRLSTVVRLLVDLCLDLIRLARGSGVDAETLDPYQDRLDEARATK